ncbi:serine/threonine protein kinase [Butyrivibrio sp. AE3004]|uniref:serine/threonine protein kinase n=1 Tax=Butyrivibrio sp. AE3004 TaxID=1506994 RepID=UPI000494BAC4|nr:serine/threonine-protein kinase [Butyrivibrio sp. AE3004]
MEGLLKKGQQLQSYSNNNIVYVVGDCLGAGGQGEVYVVDSPTGKKALKWYFKATSTAEQKNTIMNLVQDGSPSKNFLWPEDFIVSNDGTFGYIMELRPKEYRNIPDLLNRRIEPDPTFEKLILAIYNMAKEYEELHKKGYSYKDISEQNIFFKPDTGDVLVCDNDNVSGDGLDDSGVYGTMRYMAPEIVRGEASPNRNTDLYSLAVLIFCMLFISHPLEGKNEASIHALDENALKGLFGKHPVFIFDPNNDENRPVPGIHDNANIYWNLYPQFLKDKFITAFTDGLTDPNARIVEKEWRDTSIRLLDSIMICPVCGAEVFFDEEKDVHGQPHICWGCGNTITAPPQIRIGKHRILLNLTTKINEHHIKNNYNISKTVASISQNPKNPSQWGLKNESDAPWTYIRNDGSQVIVAPGQSAALVSGTKINFGQIEGTI